MDNYKPNSHRAREEGKNLPVEKKVEKVVSGKVITKKKSGLSKVADNFISEDIGNVKNYVVMDVLIPAAKKALSDIITNGIDMILYGEVRRDKHRSSGVTYTNYSKYSSSDRRDDRYRSSARAGYSHDDIVLESIADAEDVLTRMDELIDLYGQVSVADLYDLVGKTSEYTDNKYGWTNLRNAEPIRIRDGYLLKMPKAGPID